MAAKKCSFADVVVVKIFTFFDVLSNFDDVLTLSKRLKRMFAILLRDFRSGRMA